jgi:hypothetical protein
MEMEMEGGAEKMPKKCGKYIWGWGRCIRALEKMFIHTDMYVCIYIHIYIHIYIYIYI